jgi:SAM-dependent methyltransferase
MSGAHVEARRPPPNRLALRGGVRAKISQALQLFADLQVCTVRRDVRAWLNGRSGALLEVGCGDQPYRVLVPAACRYVGIDRRDAAGDFDMGVKDEVILYSGDAFPCADATFDALFHTEVLEHVYDYRAFLHECRRVLKSGGEMMFSVPFQARYHFAPHDYFRYTPSALDLMLEEAGFVEISVAPRGTDITVAAYKTVAVCFRWAYGGPVSKLLFVLTSPIAALLLAIAHASILARLGSTDDCLGYSVTARAAPASSG